MTETEALIATYPLAAASTALLAAFFMRLLLFSFIDATSWPAISLLYFGPCYPLLILFCGTAILSLWAELSV